MHKVQKVLFLFGELNDDDIDWMIATGTLEKIPAGTVLIRENQPISSFYILLQGRVSVYITVLDSSKEIAILGSGEIFGEMSFVDTRPPSATVETAEESVVLSLPRERLANRLLQDVGFASRFYRAIALFLSTRLRSAVKYLGYDREFLPEKEFNTEEMDLGDTLKENMPMARARFDWMLRRLKNIVE